MRLIDQDEQQIGITAIEKALEMAREQELDLVEVAPTANPPVCKIMDFGKFLYHQNKIDKKQKRQKQTEVKGIRLSLRTDIHDLETKAKQARGFLQDRNLIKVALVLRGREFAHMNLAREKMLQFAEMLKDISSIEQFPKKTGNTLIMMLNPA